MVTQTRNSSGNREKNSNSGYILNRDNRISQLTGYRVYERERSQRCIRGVLFKRRKRGS